MGEWGGVVLNRKFVPREMGSGVEAKREGGGN